MNTFLHPVKTNIHEGHMILISMYRLNKEEESEPEGVLYIHIYIIKKLHFLSLLFFQPDFMYKEAH